MSNHEDLVVKLINVGMSLDGARRCISQAINRGLTIDEIEGLINLYRNLEKPTVGWLYRWLVGTSTPPSGLPTPTHLVAGVDVTAKGVWYMVVGCCENRRSVIAHTNAPVDMSVEKVCSLLRDNFLALRHILIDASWAPSTKDVHECCRANGAIPFYGNSTMWTGPDWVLEGHGHCHVRASGDRTKSRFFYGMDSGNWSFPSMSRELASHLSSEIPISVVSRGSSRVRWDRVVGRAGNLLDCAVMCEVAAAMTETKTVQDDETPPSIAVIQELIHKLGARGTEVKRVSVKPLNGCEITGVGWFAVVKRHVPVVIELCLIANLEYDNVVGLDSLMCKVNAVKRCIEKLGIIGDWRIESVLNDPIYSGHILLENALFVSILEVFFRKNETLAPPPEEWETTRAL